MERLSKDIPGRDSNLLDSKHGTARSLESGLYMRNLTSSVCKSIKEIEEVISKEMKRMERG